MGIYSSVGCPKCHGEYELSLATAFNWNRIRFTCRSCGEEFEIKITNDEEQALRRVLAMLKKLETVNDIPL